MSAPPDSGQTRRLDARRTECLEAIDAALEQPARSMERAAAAVTQCLVALRDALIEARRSQPSEHLDRELTHASAALSLVYGVQFPLEGVQREKLGQVREEIANLARAGDVI